jgi:hypothetical protein
MDAPEIVQIKRNMKGFFEVKMSKHQFSEEACFFARFIVDQNADRHGRCVTDTQLSAR